MSHATPDSKRIFLEALEQESPEARARYLDETCQGDGALRARVEQLLEAHQNAGRFLGGSATSAAAFGQPLPEKPGTVIGPYKLIEQIGEGGMGLVFVAEQHEPVRRRVALKVIKPGMDTRNCLARFEAERQALALMDHPNIARVLDAGATEAGRPYFVMELVKGAPITQYCDDNRLTPRERLELFTHVCHAVQHAHQKGIIHRDIKPTNVLVASHDGQPVVKVIDFGVAKAIGQQLTERTLYTALTQMVGTPLYMSPEQAGMSSLDIDTRTDIYSLGVLLYELLTGTTPFDKERLKQAAYEELRRIIREEEPQKPSTRLSALSSHHAPREESGAASAPPASSLASIAACRHTEPTKLAKLVRGDLDWIAMKALEKDRNRRYETANGFAMDVQRYLANDAVQACPPSAAYRLRKFARRNRVAMMTTALVALALMAGTAVSAWQAIRATRARHDAEFARTQEATQRAFADQRRIEADEQRAEAESQRQRAEEARKEAIANLQKAREAVDQMLTRVSEERLRQLPHLEEVRRGLLEDALRFYQGFLQQQGDDPELRLGAAQAWSRIAHILVERDRDSEAEVAANKAITLLEKLVEDFPAEIRYQVALAGSYQHLGVVYLYHLRQREKAEENLSRASALFQKVAADGGRRAELAMCEYQRAMNLRNAGRLAEAEALFLGAEQEFEHLAAEFPENDYLRFRLGLSCWSRAAILASTNRTDESERLHRRALTILEKVAADKPTDFHTHYHLAFAHADLGSILARAGRKTEGVESYRRALEVGERVATDFPETPAHHRARMRVLVGLGSVLEDDNGLAEAEEVYRRAIATSDKVVGTVPPYRSELSALLIASQIRLAGLLKKRDQLEEAQQLDRRAKDLSPSIFEGIAARVDAAWILLACADAELWDPPLAVQLAKKAVELEPKAGNIWKTFGSAQFHAADCRAAITGLEKSMALRKGGDSFDWFFLAMAHWQLGEQDKARDWYDRAVEWMEKNQPQNEELRRFSAAVAELLDSRTSRIDHRRQGHREEERKERFWT